MVSSSQYTRAPYFFFTTRQGLDIRCNVITVAFNSSFLATVNRSPFSTDYLHIHGRRACPCVATSHTGGTESMEIQNKRRKVGSISDRLVADRYERRSEFPCGPGHFTNALISVEMS